MEKKKKWLQCNYLFLPITALSFLVSSRKQQFGGNSKMFSLLYVYSHPRCPQAKQFGAQMFQFMKGFWVCVRAHTHTRTHIYIYTHYLSPVYKPSIGPKLRYISLILFPLRGVIHFPPLFSTLLIL